jgi:hypothetical protein
MDIHVKILRPRSFVKLIRSSLVDRHQSFGGIYCPCIQGRRLFYPEVESNRVLHVVGAYLPYSRIHITEDRDQMMSLFTNYLLHLMRILELYLEIEQSYM